MVPWRTLIARGCLSRKLVVDLQGLCADVVAIYFIFFCESKATIYREKKQKTK